MTHVPLTQLAHQWIEQKRNEQPSPNRIVAVDATSGNGYDTLFLAKLVGTTGKVHTFDIQKSALDKSRALLRENGLIDRVVLHHTSHANWFDLLSVEDRTCFGMAMMNLGYLPGGDKSIITQTEQSLSFLTKASSQICDGGLISVLAYRGHPGGLEEYLAIEAAIQKLDSERFELERFPALPKPNSPILFCIQKKSR